MTLPHDKEELVNFARTRESAGRRVITSGEEDDLTDLSRDALDGITLP